MRLRKNAFYYFALAVFLLCVLFAMAGVFRRLGDSQEYPYLLKGEWVLSTLALVMCLLGAGALGARMRLRERLDQYKTLTLAGEWLLAAVLLTVGLILRIRVINDLPMEPNSDYKTFYEIAALLNRNALIEEGIGYCDYVSMFPHVFGFPAVLSWVFGLFGTSVRTALLFNLVMEMGCCVMVWRIGRLAAGRLCALFSLALVVFLPSSILYSNFVASEPLFTFLLLTAVWLFALSLSDRGQEKHPWLCALKLSALGFVLAFGSFVRPMAVIFLVAAVICLLPGEKKLPSLPRNDIPLGLRATDKGWKRCAIIVGVYLLFSSLFTMGTGYAVDRALAGSSASYGYNLLVGLNQESFGGWNQEDADYLYAALEATGSAQEAQLACRDMALERLKTDPRALINLLVHKFDVLWGNDDYGASWNILFMDQQGTLTPERESFLYRMMDVSDLYYLWLLLGSGMLGVMLFRRKPDTLYACVLLFCGTVALHLFVENQNRYHYHAIPLLALFSGAAASAMLGVVGRAVMASIEQKRQETEARVREEAEILARQRDEEERVRLRAQALHAQFDMGKAILEGHIRVVASEGVKINTVGMGQAGDSVLSPEPAVHAPGSVAETQPPASAPAPEETSDVIENAARNDQPADDESKDIPLTGAVESADGEQRGKTKEKKTDKDKKDKEKKKSDNDKKEKEKKKPDNDKKEKEKKKPDKDKKDKKKKKKE